MMLRMGKEQNPDTAIIPSRYAACHSKNCPVSHPMKNARKRFIRNMDSLNGCPLLTS